MLSTTGFSLQAKTKNPHGNLKTNCQVCHATDSWSITTQKSKFKHDETGFRLTKSHQKVACTACHRSRNFFNVGSSCADCHQDVHKGKMGTNCESCHDNDRWDSRKNQSNSIQTHQETGFPLIGVHARAECSQCHKSNQYRGTKNDCYSCHAAKYIATTAPNHSVLNIDKNCSQCHTGQTWTKAYFPHTSFSLTGAHKTTTCASCHVSGYSSLPSNTCNGCHSARYTATTNPPHASAGFNTTCETCHTTSAWTPTSYTHSAFTLTGTHKTITCASCHTSGYSSPPPNTCNGCHSARYNATTNPAHASAGFNTTCETCHTTTAWTPATFTHSFPIYSGKHNKSRGRWSSCTDCHTGGNYNTYSCIGCHSNAHHQSSNCLSCHPNGS